MLLGTFFLKKTKTLFRIVNENRSHHGCVSTSTGTADFYSPATPLVIRIRPYFILYNRVRISLRLYCTSLSSQIVSLSIPSNYHEDSFHRRNRLYRRRSSPPMSRSPQGHFSSLFCPPPTPFRRLK